MSLVFSPNQYVLDPTKGGVAQDKNLIINVSTPTNFDDVDTPINVEGSDFAFLESLPILNPRVKLNDTSAPEVRVVNGQVVTNTGLVQKIWLKSSRLLYNADQGDLVTIDSVTPYRSFIFNNVPSAYSNLPFGEGKFSVLLKTSRKSVGVQKYAISLMVRNLRGIIKRVRHRYWFENFPGAAILVYECWRNNADYPSISLSLAEKLLQENPIPSNLVPNGIDVDSECDGVVAFNVVLSTDGLYGANMYASVPANFVCYHWIEIEFFNS